MHPDADAFLDAIFDAPDDDTPRLVYADWLQEHDQEAYGQFIRLQCAAAREKLWSDEANQLWEDIGRVWTRLDEEWWPATRDDWGMFSNANLDAIHFYRGFLRDAPGLTCDQLIRYGDSCWPWLPLPEMTIRFDPDDGTEDEVPNVPRLNRVRRLHVTSWRRRALCGWPLISSPQLSNLEALDLSAGATPSSLAERMLAPGRFLRLREVRLTVFDDSNRVEESACLGAGQDPSARYLRNLRGRFEARFKKVAWHTRAAP